MDERREAGNEMDKRTMTGYELDEKRKQVMSWMS